MRIDPKPGFPQTPTISARANLWGTDNRLKTPHAYTADFSVGRELPKRFSLQLSYVGRFGRDLLTQRDLTQPLDIVDPKTGIDYYTAASALSKLARSFALASNNGAPTNYYQGVDLGPGLRAEPTWQAILLTCEKHENMLVACQR